MKNEANRLNLIRFPDVGKQGIIIFVNQLHDVPAVCGITMGDGNCVVMEVIYYGRY